MQIGIDVSAVVYGTGVSTYTQELVRALLMIDEDNEYVLFGGSLRRKGDIQKFFDSLEGSFEDKLVSIPPSLADLIWNRLHTFSIERLIGKVDVFHSSDWTQPPSNAYKVTTVHDLSHVKFPDLVHPRVRSVQQRRLERVRREVDRIIVPSTTTKNDLVELGYDDEKITVIPEAIDSSVTKVSANQISKTKKKYGIEGKYVLGVGVNPRKNTKKIVEAYKNVREQLGIELVLVGHHRDEVQESEGVHLTGHVSDEDFPAFYAGAEVLVYPSIYEGFGIPILDAFSIGLPVVTSNLGSMKEVAGSAAVLVDPESVDSIARGIKKAVLDKEELIIKGLKRVKQFSWQKAARQTLEVYEMVS